jgi:amino acid adenylation domain-containing protein
VTSRLRSAFGIEMPLRDLFEAPILADLAARVEAALRAGTGQAAPPLVPVSRDGALPLSFAQQRLWFIDQLQPGSDLYNLPVALRVEGPLGAAVLARSLGEVVRRHEALRTVFPLRDGLPVQVIQPAAPFLLPVVDLSGLPESRREALALTLAGEEAGRPFDLARGPLLRGVLLRLAAEDHVAALTTHHIASDGWSEGILVREVMALYAAFAEGRPSPLPELPVQYVDFAVWQLSWLQGEILENEISYWRRQLAGLPPLLLLPTDRPRPAVQSFRGASRPIRLPAELTRRAETLGRRQGATLFMVLLAGFQTLLARYSGQQDVAVGSPVAGRNRVEIEGLIGFFVNTLVLRGDLAGEPSFRELLGRARESALAAHTHQDVPFDKLVEELTSERSLAHGPLFQVMFVLQNAPAERLAIRDLRVQPVSGAGTTSKFDLRLSLGEHSGGLDGTLEFATDLFDAATIDRLIVQYEGLLGAGLETPETGVWELPLLPAAERHQVLVEWNDTAVDREEPARIHELFEAWAKQTPEAVAVVWGDEEITYGQLEAQANRLAHHLAHLGIGPGSLAGIHLRRGPGMIVAVLAVLKAGAAYVPLEIGNPPARLRVVLGSLEIPCLITESAQLGALREIQESLPALTHVVCLDLVDLQGCEPLAPQRRATPDGLAYVIFTSGSTGTPKGVMVRRRPVANLLRWAHRTFAFSPEDRVLFVTSLSFDLSVFDIFGLLGAGGSIRIATEEEVRDPQRLLKALAEEPITFWDSAPAALEQTVPFLGVDPQPEARLRLVFLSGDWIPVTLPDRIRGRFPGARVISLGGATEATVWSNVFPVETVGPSWTSIPYGRPIENARYHVLDVGLAPCPVGVPGDLYIGGDCLADGYARAPELTAHKFLPDPGATAPGARLYRTGDRARYLPDGNLEFLGRRDHQVKIRGFRIELGEIEAALATLPGVREAVVMVREERSEAGSRDRRLVAYVTGDAAADALRRSLRERLPDYMVPAAFVTLAALPLTPNGKVDRQALPAPEAIAAAADGWIAPRTPIEEMVAGIWGEILQVSRVERDGDFFALGGHSLLATRVIARVREAFGVELPMRALFEAPTLAALAERIEALVRAGFSLAAPPIVAVSRDGELPLSFAQQRLWFLHQLDPGSAAYNSPVAVRLAGPLDLRALEQSLTEVVRRHEVLRTRFEAVRGLPRQVIVAAGRVRLNLADLSGLPDERRDLEIRRLAAQEAELPFDLARGPLLRAGLLRSSDAEHVCLLTLHHIVFDGWSESVLVREISVLYRAFTRGEPSPLPELPIQYADFAHWQRGWLAGEALEVHLRYWRRRLAGAPPLLALPADRPRPANPSLRGARQPFVLPEEVVEALRRISRKEGATLFMTLLAGFKMLLHRLTGRDDLVAGTDIANRTRPELEGLIGFFVNGLALRTDLSGNPTFRELLARVRDLSLEAYAHQDLPFERLVEELQPRRDPSYNPIFQVLFVLQNAPREVLDLGGLQLSAFSSDAATAKFDLAVFLGESGERISGFFEYSTDLFDASTIAHFTDQFCALLSRSAARPEARLSTLATLAAAKPGRPGPREERRQEVRAMKFKSIKPKMVSLPQEDLVRAEPIAPGESLPLVLRPNAPGLDLADWATANRSFVESELLAHGGLLFRGFDLSSTADFERFAGSLCPDLFGEYGDLPREGMGGKVYSSTPYPADKPILFHNESSHLPRWPMRIFFFCVQPAEQGGETPIVDCREVYRRLSPETRRRFAEKRLMYVRNYTAGLDVSWSDFFRTTDHAQVEARCREMGTEVEWKDGNGLRTRQICRAVAQHPTTGEPVFFNQVQLHHVSALDPEVRHSLLSLFPEEDLPRNVYYGDGTPIEDEVMAEVGTVLRDCAVEFTWQTGDVVMLDNMLTAHSRNPYVGPRKIVVALGQMYSPTS